MEKARAQSNFDLIRVLLLDFFKEMRKKNVTFLAAAISYNSFLLLTPFLLLVISAIGFLGIYLPFYGFDLNLFLKSVIGKYGEQVYRFAQNIIRKRFGYGAVGFVGLLATFSFVIGPIEGALNQVFEVKQSRSFWMQRLLGVLLFMFVIFLFVAFAVIIFIFELLITFIKKSNISFFKELISHPYLIRSSFLMSILFAFSVFLLSFFFYRFLTLARVSSAQSLIGSAFSAISIEIGRQAYLVYLKYFPIYDMIYGTFSFVFVTLVFIYFSVTCFLSGAVLIRVLQKHSIFI
ncbi:MAG: YihY/virulence factor BrkB family protein [Actinobacteria bacterium]|nr:YihY/virulence factor BrkB family protein [Actinomycetota bacterium]